MNQTTRRTYDSWRLPPNMSGQLVEQWPDKPLSEIAEVIMGQAPPGSDCNKDGIGSPFVKAGEFGTSRPIIREWTTNPKKFASRDDVLICVVGATCGKLNLGENCAIGRSVAAIRPNKSELNQFFLHYFMMQIVQKMRAASTGAAQTVISKKMIHEIRIPLPSLEEQQRIVNILDEAFERIETNLFNSKEGLDNANLLFKSKLTHTFNEMNVEYVDRKIVDVTSLVTDGKHGNCVNEENSGFYFLSAKDVKNGRLHYENARQITKEDFEETHRRTNLEPGDILLTNAGTIGRTAIASTDERTYQTTFQKSVAVIKPITEIIDSEYCIFHLRADLDKLVNVSAGTAQKNLLLRDIRSHTIKCPTLAEQRKIVAYLNNFERNTQLLESHYVEKLGKMTELKQALLQEAFNGTLRITEGLAG